MLVQVPESGKPDAVKVARPVWNGGKAARPYLSLRKQQHEQKGAAGRPQFTGRGVAALSEQEARVKKLEREFEITRQERDILKKALAFFAKEN